MDFERGLASESSGSRLVGLPLASPLALAALASTAGLAVLAALVGGCVSSAELAAAHDARGDALFSQGKLEAALAEYREAVRLDPSDADLWLQLGQVHEQMGRGEDALRALEKGLEIAPNDAGILNHLAWFHATVANPTHRDPAKALAYAQRAVEASGGADPNILDTLAEAYFANRDFDAAIETEQRALELAPELEALQNQLEKFRAAKAAESGR